MNSSTENNFTDTRTGTGTFEWAEETYSFEVGCPVGCQYCWARHGMLRRKAVASPESWLTPRTNFAKLNKGWRKHPGVIMFPGTHNIGLYNIENSLKILSKMLAAGNKVLITIKPSREIVQQLTTALMPYKAQILFRFSIGSTKNRVLEAWEPHGPSFNDRYSALQVAYYAGFQTSVSAEPLLGGVQTALDLMKLLRPYITHDLWFGFMRKIEQRVIEPSRELIPYIEEIQFLHCGPTALLLERLVVRESNLVLIRLKESVRTAAQEFKCKLKGGM